MWATALSIAAPIVMGMLSGNSADKGVAAQAEAATSSNKLQKYMYDTTRADNAPFLRTGTAANTRLAGFLGLGPKTGVATPGFTPMSEQEYYAKNPIATKMKRAMYEDVLGDDGSNNVPASDDGAAYRNYLAANPSVAATDAYDNTEGYGDLTRRFSAADIDKDPVYQSGLQFGLDEGRKGIERQASATGSMLSGATLKALSRFGNDYASTKANDSFNRFNTENTGIYNKLAGLSGTGQVAANQVGTAGQNYATSVGNTMQGLGNARAASGIASSNALMNGVSNAFGNYQSQQYLDLLKNKFGGGSNIPAYNAGSEAGYWGGS